MNYKLTSVKILKDLYKKFKYNALSDEFTLQKLVNSSMDLYLIDIMKMYILVLHIYILLVHF